MFHLRKWIPAIVLSSLAVNLACLGDTTSPIANATSPNGGAVEFYAGDVGPLCELGCIETDPNPTANGYFLGSGVTPQACFGDEQTDADADALGDFCEKNLAQAFAPELYYWYYDEVGREPYWLAQRLADGTVRVGYLIGYYRDAGSSWGGCSVPLAPPSCFGHNGDSEAIFLDVAYVASTSHWVLQRAWYSAHGDFYEYPGLGKKYFQLVGNVSILYPGKKQGYPRAYVAQGKHANYASKSHCDQGGFGESDTCEEVNTASRVVVMEARNIGNRSMRLLDCVTSQDPSYQYYGSGRQECLWSGGIFRGWIPDSIGGAASEGYGSVIGEMGL